MPRACIVAVVLFLAALSPASASAAPVIAVSPNPVSFGDVFVGTTSARTVTVSNTGDASFDINSIVTDSLDFVIIPGTCNPPTTVAAGGSCSFQVSFTPPARGLSQATLTISNTASGTTTVPLQGKGTAPVTSLSPPAGLAFGDQKVGTTSGLQTVTVSNNGDAPLSIISVTRTGANTGDFSAPGGTCTPFPKSVSPGTSCTLTVTFTPSVSGARTAALQLNTNDPAAADVPLSGTGTKPQIGVDPGSILFDDQLASSVSAGRTLTVRNTGTAPMSLSAAELTGANPGEFAIAGGDCLPLPATVPAGGSCSLTVTFGPTGAGGRLATIHLVSDGGTADVPIGGTGTAPPADAAGQAPTDTPSPADGPDEVVDVTVKPDPNCVVPRLTGKTLAAAKRALKKAHCAIGKVTKRASKKRPGRVISQSRRPGRKLRNGAKVGVVLARRA